MERWSVEGTDDALSARASEKVFGDHAHGTDTLSLDVLAEVMAELFMDRNTEPPFALGIFGNWGQGKSFFFHLILKHIIRIQKMPAKNIYVRHNYVVKFNSWTFSKSSSVARSLLYQIKRDLNVQLQFEAKLEETKETDTSTIEMFLKLERRYPKDGETLEKEFLEILEQGDIVSEPFLRAIYPSYEKDDEKLRKLQAQFLEQTSKGILNFFGTRALQKALQKALEKNNGGDINKSIIEIRDIMSKAYFTFQLSNISLCARIWSLFFVTLAIVLFYIFQDTLFTTAAGLFSTIIPVISSASKVMGEIDPIVEQLQTLGATEQGREVDSFETIELKHIKRDIREIENRKFVRKGQSLQETNFGIIHKVKQEIQLISNGMLSRKERRVVLFVDDLDRCQENIVLEVLEALELVAKSKLFVVVLATDPNLTALSLEKSYGGLLDPHSSFSGIDFLEKIVQIPIRLPRVGQHDIESYVHSMIEVVDPGTLSEKNASSSNTFSLPKSNWTDAITTEERDMLKEIFNLFKIHPRCMKRNINIFKVLRVIWKRQSERFQADFELKRATVFLIVLASEGLTREVTHNIFQWMELENVYYHHIMCGGDVLPQNENNLANLFKTNLLKQKKLELAPSTEAIREGPILVHINKYLKQYKWGNIEEWIEISKQFLLARCFCFYRLETKTRDIEQKSLLPEEIDIDKPTKMDHRKSASRWRHGGVRSHSSKNETTPLLSKD